MIDRGVLPRFRAQIDQLRGLPRFVHREIKQALAFADRGYVLASGANRHEGTGAALLADRDVAAMFLGG